MKRCCYPESATLDFLLGSCKIIEKYRENPLFQTKKLRNLGTQESIRKPKTFLEVKHWTNFRKLKNEGTKKQEYSIWKDTSNHCLTESG